MLSRAIKKRLYCILTLAERKNILLQWTSARGPTVKGWQRILQDLVPLEYLTCALHYKTDFSLEVWEPYLDYVEPESSAARICLA